MTIRLKESRLGAQHVLRDGDLLIATIMPPSKHVHVAKAIVSGAGRLEFAEWILRFPTVYQHRTKSLSQEELDSLRSALATLGNCARPLAMDDRDFDPSEYETPSRRFLRFRFEGREVNLFAPSRAFYSAFGLNQIVRRDFENAFETVITHLPINWVTPGTGA